MPRKFDPKNIERLDNPERAQWQSIEAFLKVLQPRAGMTYADIGCALQAAGFQRLREHAIYPYHHVIEAE